MNLVVGRTTHHLVEDGPHPQGWYEVRCDQRCVNAGPWRVYGPVVNNERYVCSRCGAEMHTDAV